MLKSAANLVTMRREGPRAVSGAGGAVASAAIDLYIAPATMPSSAYTRNMPLIKTNGSTASRLARTSGAAANSAPKAPDKPPTTL